MGRVDYSRTTSEAVRLTGTSDRACQTRGTEKLGGLQKESEVRQGQNDSKDITKEATARQKVVTDDLHLPSSVKATGLTQWRHHDTNRGFVPEGRVTMRLCLFRRHYIRDLISRECFILLLSM